MTDGARRDGNLISLAGSLGDWAEVLRGGELGSVERVADLLEAAAAQTATYSEHVGNTAAALDAEADAYDRLSRRYDDRGDVLSSTERELARLWTVLEAAYVERDSAEHVRAMLERELEAERASFGERRLSAVLEAFEIAEELEAERRTAEWEDA